VKQLLLFILICFSLNMAAQQENVWFEKAVGFYENAAFDSSIIYFTKLIETYPDSSQLYYNRGLAYYGEEKWEPAKQDLLKVMTLRQNDIKALQWLAKISVEENKWEEAIADYEKLYELTGNSEVRLQLNICKVNLWISNYWLYFILLFVSLISLIIIFVKKSKKAKNMQSP